MAIIFQGMESRSPEVQHLASSHQPSPYATQAYLQVLLGSWILDLGFWILKLPWSPRKVEFEFEFLLAWEYNTSPQATKTSCNRLHATTVATFPLSRSIDLCELEARWFAYRNHVGGFMHDLHPMRTSSCILRKACPSSTAQPLYAMQALSRNWKLEIEFEELWKCGYISSVHQIPGSSLSNP